MNIYTINLHFAECTFKMPWFFTSFKDAVLYGEYEYRTDEDLLDYEIEKCIKPTSFYKLK